MNEPKWRRWSDEKPADGSEYVIRTKSDGVVVCWRGIEKWDGDVAWMPLDEWQAVLDAIPGPLDPDEWIVNKRPNGGGFHEVARRDGSDRFVTEFPSLVAKALNEMEGR